MPLRRVVWRQAWRIIASRYPPTQLFERVSPDPAVWEALIALEQATNPRVRDETGRIALVAPEDRISGPGSSYVMAAFTHLNPYGSRFSDGGYGIYYAARELRTALAETIFHFEAFARDAGDPARSEDMRVLVGGVDESFEDVAALPKAQRDAVLDPLSYVASQRYGRAIWDRGGPGVLYPSVRDPGGECVGAFRPRLVGVPMQERHLAYHWNGSRVDRYFDYSADCWVAWPGGEPTDTPGA